MKIKTYRYYAYYLLIAGTLIIRLLPVKIARLLGRYFGSIGFLFGGKVKATTIKNLTTAFPEKSWREIYKAAQNVFANVSGNFAEFVHIGKLTKNNADAWVNAYGLEKLDRVFEKGKGAIVLTAHFGNWEMVGAYLRVLGYEGVTIVRKIYFDKYDKYLRGLRSVYKMSTIYRDESPKKMLYVLKKNKVLGMLADQDIDSIEGVFVNFFGRPAYTPTAPVRLAIASSAPLVPCFMLWDGNKYSFFVDDPIYIDKTKDKEEALTIYTQQWSSVLESYVRKYPDQWVWMHERWKTKPDKIYEKVT